MISTTHIQNKWAWNVSRSGAMLKDVWVLWKDKYYWVGNDGKWLDKPTWISSTRPNDGCPIYE